jgi:putative flippase GtrA
MEDMEHMEKISLGKNPPKPLPHVLHALHGGRIVRVASVSVRVMKFALVGALGIAVQLGVLHVLAGVLGAPYLIATAAAVATAIVHNFAWHRSWTWHDRRSERMATGFATFALANGLISLVGNVLAVSVLVGVIHLPVVAANLIAIAACGVANFSLADTVVFRRSVLDPNRHLAPAAIRPGKVRHGDDGLRDLAAIGGNRGTCRRKRRHSAEQVGCER